MSENDPDSLSTSQKDNGVEGATFYIMSGVLLFGLIWWCAFAAPNMALWYDESVFNYKGWLLVQGHFSAYQDIYLESPPLAYYPIGIAQALFGPATFIGRVFGAVCFFAGTLVCALAAMKIGGKNAFILSLALSMGHIFSASFYCTGMPYALSMLICAGCLYLLSDPEPSTRKIILAGALSGFAACIHHLMPIFTLGVIVYLFLVHGSKKALSALAFALGAILLVLGPFAGRFGSLINAWFPGRVYQHMDTAYKVFTPFSWDNEIALLFKFIMAYLPVLLILAVGMRRIHSGENKPGSGVTFGKYFATLFIIMAAVAAWGHGLTARDEYAQHALYFFPLLLVPAAGIGARKLQSGPLAVLGICLFTLMVYFTKFSNLLTVLLLLLAGVAIWAVIRKIKGEQRSLLLLIPMIVAMVFSSALSSQLWLRVKGGEVSDIERIQVVADALARHTTVKDKVLTYGAPYFLLDAGRIGFASTINREKAMTFEEEDGWYTHKHNFFTTEDLYFHYVNQADCILLDSLGHTYFKGKNTYTDTRASSATSRFRYRVMNMWTKGELKFAEAINPGDLSINGGRPIRIYVRNEALKTGAMPDGMNE